MKKISIIAGFIILLALFIPNNSNATTDEKIQIGNLYYKIISEEYKMVEVDGVCQKDVLTSVTIPKTIKIQEQDYTVTDIGKSAFKECKNLTNITIPDSVTYIGSSAFWICENLTNVTIPNSVKYIGDMAFYSCTSLTNIIIPNSVKYLGNGALSYCNDLSSVVLSDSLTRIELDTFANDTSLTNIIIPNGVTYIGASAFVGTSLISITIPKTVTSIDFSAFRGLHGEASNCENIVVITPRGSYAEIYAKENDMKLKLIESTTENDNNNDNNNNNNNDNNNKQIPFTDVKDTDWFANAVKYVYNNNIIKGYDDTTFAPNDNLTRGQLVTILHRMEGSPAVTGKTEFPDVQDSKQYYYKAVKWATDNKIASGYNTGKFGPEDNITREQLAVILNRYAKYKGKDVSATKDLSEFKDANKISSYAISQMKWAVGAGVITGNADKTLNPQGTATRAEVAAMLEKYCKKIGR